MNTKWLICVGFLVIVGCGKNEERDHAKAESERFDEAESSVYNQQADTGSAGYEVEEVLSNDVFAEVFDSGSYLSSKDRLQTIAGEEYLSLAEDEFKRASNELIQYRSALAQEKRLSAWLLAADIENALSTAIIKKVEHGELSISAAQSLLKQYSERFYSAEGVARVFDEELAVKRSQRFEAVEVEILKDQLGVKKPKDASTSQRYAALFHHISGITGGLGNQVKLDWAGDAYGIVILTELFNAQKNAAMASIYLEHLSDGGTPLGGDQQSIENFKEAIGEKLRSTKLVEFSGFGYTGITPHEMTTFLSGI